MPRKPTIIVGTDLVTSENAVTRAEHIARAHGATLHLVHATRKLPPALRALVSAEAADERRELAQLEVTANRTRAAGIRTHSRVVLGSAASSLRQHARVMNASLIVLGSRGQSMDSLVGSTAERVIEKDGPPVLLVRERGTRAHSRIVVAVAADTDLRRCVAAAQFVAEHASLTLVHACEGPFDNKLVLEGASAASLRVYRRNVLREAEEAMRPRVIAAAVDPSALRVVYGVPWRALEREAKRGALLVIDRHHSRLAHALFGSVSREVIARTTNDVVLV